MTDKITAIDTGPNDKQIADEVYSKLRPLLDQAAVVMTDALRSGIKIEFHLGVDGFGRFVVQRLDISKVLR